MKWIIGIFIIFLCLVIYSYLLKDVISNKKYNLKEHGCTVVKNILNEKDITYLKNNCEKGNYKEVKKYIVNHKDILNCIHTYVDKDYEFQDYILIIQKSAIHTCHRDYNGDMFNKNQNAPSYTIIFILEEMEKCLGVIPKSHKGVYTINIKNQVIHLACEKGDMIMFDANLIHVGALNQKDDNLRIQMKITHKDDRDVIDYYENYHKVMNQIDNYQSNLSNFNEI